VGEGRGEVAVGGALVSRPRVEVAVPALALRRAEAAAALGLSVDTFDRHVRPQLRVLYVGDLRLWPVEELTRWLRENAREVPS
jgi:hypothetical protein